MVKACDQRECCAPPPAAPAASANGKPVSQAPAVFQQQEFGKFMFRAEWSSEADGWTAGEVTEYGPISLDPHAQVLNYGQSIFEGMRAYKSPSGQLLLFRPSLNAERFAQGAARMCMPLVPQELFIRAVEQVVRANASQIPEAGNGSLYLRPLLMGTGGILGLAPAPTYTFLVYAVPSPTRLKDGKMVPVRLRIEHKIHRAAPRGNGATKAAGNYSQVLVAQQAARAQGYADVVYLDPLHDTYLEEGSGFNIFVVTGGGTTLTTPAASGTILDGVTRRSLMRLAADAGLQVVEGPISVEAALQADEMFASGTAVVVMSVSALTYQEQEKQYQAADEPGAVAKQLFMALTAIQEGRVPDPYGWVHPVLPAPENGVAGGKGVQAGGAALPGEHVATPVN